MRIPAALLLQAAALALARAGEQVVELACCFASAASRNDTVTLGPVVVLRRDEEAPQQRQDPTWEVTLRRAAARALAWEGDGDQLTQAPFLRSTHSAAALAAQAEPGDIRVLARGLLVLRAGHPVFQESDLPGEQCRHCEFTRDDIKATWSVRRLRHSGPNADRRPCYELQFSVTPVAPERPELSPLSRWSPPGQARQRDLRPKGLVLRVQATQAALAAAASTTTGIVPMASRRPPMQVSPLPDPLMHHLSGRLGGAGVTQHMHHHFYVGGGGTPLYAGSTAQYPTPLFRPSPQYHEYSQPDPLFHPAPQSGHPNSINEQLPPAGDGTDTRVPYVRATPASTSTSSTASTTLASRPQRPWTQETPSSQMYRITGGYTLSTPDTKGSTTLSIPDTRGSSTPHTFKTPKPTKAYTSTSSLRPHTSTRLPSEPPTEYLSAYPAASVRGTAPTAGTTPLFTPHYGGRDFEMSILRVMTSKVPSYIDIFKENGVSITTVGPTTVQDGAIHPRTTRHPSDSGTTYRGPYAHEYPTTNSFPDDTTLKLSTTLQTRAPESTTPLFTAGAPRRLKQPLSTTTASVTYYVASEDLNRQPLASTLTSEHREQDEPSVYQYTILNSVKKSIEVMKHENDTFDDALQTSTDSTSITRRVDAAEFASQHEDESENIVGPGFSYESQKVRKSQNTTENQILPQTKKPLLITEPSTTTRRPWRPSTRRPWRQRGSYKQQYLQRKRGNHTATALPVDPTSIVESRRTYSIRTSRRNKPFYSQQGKVNTRLQKFHKRPYYSLPLQDD